ncbi:cytosolic carboxypeptidase 2 [Fopius arisanus]|uniref:Cytosolic carboxypeptidase 2 n=1 Tax=Fopius arisanus TaxID=64838 RepID=A0A9R1SXD8_9HYME|nr:PREDICTED: cytosolic carboxypeptidase 2 [Fopius arisanus]
MIVGNFLTTQCLQDRFGFSRRDVDSVLPITSSILKYREADVQPIDAITQEPRWPTECKVIQERVRHIDYSPPMPEPYYVPTGKEPKPKPISEDMGTVIYAYNPMSATNYFSRSCAGGTVVLTSSDIYTSLEEPGDTNPSTGSNATSDLKFESRFESGNLGKAIKITDTYYQLHLRKDLYTQRHMQWFYFRISNTKSKTMYRLSIVNFCKEDSLYNEGLRPLLYSTKDASLHAVGWRRCGDNITYYKNDSSDEEKEKHTLTFNITFPHDQDTVYLAHCYPYTYTDLQEYLTRISSDPVKSRFTKLRLLCRTLAGNSVHYLTITAPNYNDEGRKKKGIVITARVHPGETPSSWMMKGIIDFLTGESNQARELRERFIFKLVPMLNPDGVIVGNNRCSLSGKDLNRQYRTVMRESYPSVWHTKLMIRRLMEECGIAIYCDLHAHSRKHNIFIYGCESKRAGCYGKLTEQIFPLMLHKNAADKFSFENCKFHIEKGKEGTSRVVVWLMGVQNSYTMEASMGGSKLGSRNGTHFCAQDYEQIGKAFCETLLDFSDDDPTKERLRNKILVRLMKEGSSADEPTNINLTDYSSDEGDTSDSSSEEMKLGTSEATILLDSETSGDYRSHYLSVPPPSPQLPRSRNSNKPRKIRKKTKMEDSRNIRQKLLNRRSVMDLPATDPGSDMCCDLTDSADEYYMTAPLENPRKSASLRRSFKETYSAIEKRYEVEKKEYETETLPLLRPHTLAFVEESVSEKITCKVPRRTRGTQPPRFMRYLSPILPRSQDVQIKLTSLRQQIWTGVSDIDCNQDNDEFRAPLSWGVSQLALMCQKNSEALLKSCSKKLESLNSSGKSDTKKSKKSTRNSARAPKSQASEENPEDESQKNPRKKRIRFKRQKAVISGSNPLEDQQPAPATETGDSLKLFGVGKLPKPQKAKPDPKKKFRRSGIVATATIHVAKIKNKPTVENFTDSSSSEDVPTTSTRPRTNKKKKKPSLPKKRALSANYLLSDKS